MDITLILCCIFLIIFISLYLLWIRCSSYFRIRREVNKLPGPRGLPILGNALDLNVDHSEIVNVFVSWWLQFKEKGLFHFKIMDHICVVLCKAQNVETLLSSINYIEKAKEYEFLQPWLGTGLLTSSGVKWRSRRKMLTPAFHFKILEDFVDILNEQSEILIQNLNTQIGKESFDLFPYITLCTLDIICDTAMGRHVNAQKNSDSEYVKALYKITDIIHSRHLLPWLRFNWIFKWTSAYKEHSIALQVLHDFSKKVIQERKAEKKSESKIDDDEIEPVSFRKKRRMAFLDLLLHASDNGNILNDEDIREEVDTFMFEGHDTTAAGLVWLFYLLGRHPEIQERVYEETESILKGRSHITSEDLREMKYMECAIKESLRLFPPVPVFGRTLKEPITLGKHTIPAGISVVIMLYLLHRDPEVFPDAETFDPDRFLIENCQGRHPYAYVPFSAGPRNCIGQKFAMMELKIVVAHVLRAFHVEALHSREELKIINELILRPKDGILVKLRPRIR